MAKETKPEQDANRRTTRGTPKAGQAVFTKDQVRRRAYELFLARGDTPDDALGDWLRAERELRDEVKSGRARSTRS